MELKDYIATTNTNKSAMARLIGVSYDQLNQWCVGIRPIPIRYCASIEQITNAQVTRKDARPNDWQSIWPDLAAPP